MTDTDLVCLPQPFPKEKADFIKWNKKRKIDEVGFCKYVWG